MRRSRTVFGIPSESPLTSGSEVTDARLWEDNQGMTVKLGEGGGNNEAAKKGSRKLEGCEEEEEDESGEVAGDERSTKSDGHLHPAPSSSSSSSSAATAAASSSNPQPSHGQDQHHFLRSSVRPPSKRLRKDAGPATLNGLGTARGKGSENGGAVVGACNSTGTLLISSGGASKTPSRSLGPTDKEEGNKKKARRQWESWSAEDKNSFFEGLYEHGKDFEAIQNNIALKYKKKGKPASMVKNKEQVRHFYYRTWHKISKYIDSNNVFSRNLKKSSQELYGLICYAELRKKIGGCMDDKNAAKLNELIQVGATTVRYNGRKLRIKAPMCRALKRLCDPDGISDEEDQKPVRLPLRVPVELQPRSNHSWARVQSLSHNPRLRMVVELHRKLSSLIEFLKQKWAVNENRIRKTLEEGVSGQSPSFEEKEELYLYPTENSTLTSLPGVARVVHSKAFCTVHWQESGKCRSSTKELPAAHILGIQATSKGPGRPGSRKESPTSTAEDAQGADESDLRVTEEEMTDNKEQLDSRHIPTGQHVPEEGRDGVIHITEGVTLNSESLSCSVNLTLRHSEEEQVSHEGSEKKHCSPQGSRELLASDRCDQGMVNVKGGTVVDINGAQHTKNPTPSDGSERAIPPPSHSDSFLQTEGTKSSDKDICTRLDEVAEDCTEPCGKETSPGLLQQVRGEGWSARSTENVTLAELYLMLGKPGKLQLEYDWLPVCQREKAPPMQNPERHTQRLLKCLLQLVSTEVNPKPCSEVSTSTTSPLKSVPEDQPVVPPGKNLAVTPRSPSCGRSPASVRGSKVFSPTAGSPGVRSASRTLLIADPTRAESGEGESAVFAVPTTLPPNSRHGKMFSPNKEAEISLRQQLDSINMQSDLFLPKQRKFRNRHLRKPLVVQRTLLPRPTGDASQHVCSFSILSNSSVTGTGSFRPIQSSLGKAHVARPIVPKVVMSSSSEKLTSAIDVAAKVSGILPTNPVEALDGADGLPRDSSLTSTPLQMVENPDSLASKGDDLRPSQPPLHNGLSTSPSLLSPPNVSALLDISLPGPPEDVLSQDEPATHISDSIIELAINSASYGDGSSSLSPSKLNGSDSSKSLPSPSSSPRCNWIESPSHDPQWYPSDSTDSSLGCLLSSLISPDKGRKMLLTPTGNSSGSLLLGPSLLDGNSRDSFVSRSLADVGEVDSQLACMISENSVDYIARFNDLAQELAVTDPPPRKEVLFEGSSVLTDLSQ
ncbi:protein cramped-like isoform X1 [Polypterus senegalus]|uniref:protein cramped-like isoform X1 n=2 Tax=Polypterus senegalus TaxID=55291 RepID=UPI001964A9B2|nr:protein cramped-like isoform X1 [Polypterus senegalus]